MSYDMTKSTKWVCAQRRLRSAWISAQSDQSSLWAQWVAKNQVDLSLRWTHTHFVGFVMSWLITEISINIRTVVNWKHSVHPVGSALFTFLESLCPPSVIKYTEKLLLFSQFPIRFSWKKSDFLLIRVSTSTEGISRLNSFHAVELWKNSTGHSILYVCWTVFMTRNEQNAAHTQWLNLS